MKTIIARTVLTIAFAFSGFMKTIKHDEFIESLAQISFLDHSFFSLIGFIIPAVEIILAAMMAAGLFTKMVSLATASLLLLFTAVYIPVLVDPSVSAQCVCFGVASDIDIWFVVRNASLFGVAFFLFTQDKFAYSLDQWRKKK